MAASQIISNVPAALLLSGFTDNYGQLVIGVNLGGLYWNFYSEQSLLSGSTGGVSCGNGTAEVKGLRGFNDKGMFVNSAPSLKSRCV